MEKMGPGNGEQGPEGETVVIFEDGDVVTSSGPDVAASDSSLEASDAPPLDPSDIEPTSNQIN